MALSRRTYTEADRCAKDKIQVPYGYVMPVFAAGGVKFPLYGAVEVKEGYLPIAR